MTPQQIAAARPGDPTLWDDLVPGLHLRVKSETVKSFYLYYRTTKRPVVQRRPKIGDARILSLADARRIAKEMLVEVAAGGDPSRDRIDARGELTLKLLYEACRQAHWSNDKYQKSRHALEVEKLWKKHVEPAFGPRRLSDVTAADVREWHANMLLTPTTANRSLSVLSTMFRFAELKEWRGQNTNPCELVQKFSETARERRASPEEIGRVGELLEHLAPTFPAQTAFIYLLIYSGSRPSAIERATWDDLTERPDGMGTLSVEGKTGRDKILLPAQVMSILAELPRHTPTLTGIKFPRAFWEKIREDAGCETLWARDWRRTFASTALGAGVNVGQISELLNHRSTQTTKIYAKLDDSAAVAAVSTTAAELEELLGAPDSHA